MTDIARDLSTPDSYGPLPQGFTYPVRWGYTALTGPNNSGKSALLQLVFRLLLADGDFGGQRTCLILPDRLYIDPTTETGGFTLANYNDQLVDGLRTAPLVHAVPQGPTRSALARALINNSSLIQQVRDLDEALLPRLGFPSSRLASSQQIQLEEIAITMQGSGLRGLFPILAALTDPGIRAILIDEPELSLEPRLQRVVRDLLVERSECRIVLVATHSHLFLRHDVIDSTQVMEHDSTDRLRVRTLESQDELMDVVFKLLGNSTEDLFFPATT